MVLKERWAQEMEQTHLLFFYGTLMSIPVLSKALGRKVSKEELQLGLLNGYEVLEGRLPSQPGEIYPLLMEAPGKQSWGNLFRATPEERRILQKHEAPNYHLKPVMVFIAFTGQWLEAEAFFPVERGQVV